MKLSKAVFGSVAALTLTVSAAFATVPAQTSSCAYQFNSNLRLGAVSSDVQNLQKLLNMDAATRVAATGAGSTGFETMRFGPATMAAVKKFQAANGIAPVSGYVGPLTRAVLNTVCSSSAPVSTTNPTTNTGTGVVANNIPVSVLVQKQASAKLGEFVVSGNGNVTVLELSRIGLSNNNTLSNVYLYDGNTRLTDGSSVLTDGTIRFTSTSGLFSVSGAKTITVRADIGDSTSGQTVGVAMKSVTMAGGTATPVTGVNGPLFSISSATLIGANFTGSVVPAANTTTTINAGSVNQTLWSQSINISSNPAMFKGIQFKMIGSAPSNTLTNVQLYVDGVSKGTASMNTMGQYVFDMMSNPATLSTGAHTVELRGDVVAGADREFYMSLENPSDVKIEDSRLPGVMVTPTNGGNSFSNIVAGTIKVAAGTLTVNQDTSFNNTTSLVGGASNVKLGAWKIYSYGEDVKVTSLSFLPTFTTTQGNNLANVGLYVNGGQVGSNVTATTGSNISFNNLGTNVYVPAGQFVTLELRGDVMTSTSTTLTSGTVKFDLVAGTNNAQGIQSSKLASLGGQGGQLLTIASSNVQFDKTAGSAASTKAPNQTGVKIGSFTLQTGSAEGVTVTNITVGLNTGAGSLLNANQISNVTVKDGSTVLGTPVGNPTSSNNYSTNVSVAMNTTKVFDVYADFGSNAAGATVTPTMALTIRGNTSNLSSSVSAVTGVMTTANVAQIQSVIASANTGVTFVPASSPVGQLVVAGQSAFNIGTMNVKATNGVAGGTLKDISFVVPANTIGSVTINGKTASIIGTAATITDVGVNVPADASGVNVPVTVSLVCVNSTGGCAGVSNSALTLSLTGYTYNDGVNVISTTTAARLLSANHNLVASKPALTVAQSSTGGLSNGNVKLGEVTISADAAGDIEITQLPVTIASTSGITVSNMMVKDSSGSSVIVGTSGSNVILM
jgi:hypothetical protein